MGNDSKTAREAKTLFDKLYGDLPTYESKNNNTTSTRYVNYSSTKNINVNRRILRHNHYTYGDKHVYLHRPRQRNIVSREYIQYAPITIRYNMLLRMLVICSFLIFLITANLGTLAELEIEQQKIESTIEVNYDAQYLASFREDTSVTKGFNRIIEMGKAFSNFGKQDTWLLPIANMGSETKSNLAIVTNIVLLPFNFVIHVFNLGRDLLDAIVGRPVITNRVTMYQALETINKYTNINVIWDKVRVILPW